MATKGKWKISVWHNGSDNLTLPIDINCRGIKYHINVTNEKYVFLSSMENDLGSDLTNTGWNYSSGYPNPPVTGSNVTVNGIVYNVNPITQSTPWIDAEEQYDHAKKGNGKLNFGFQYGRVKSEENLTISGDHVYSAVDQYGENTSLDLNTGRINDYEKGCTVSFSVGDVNGSSEYVDGNSHRIFIATTYRANIVSDLQRHPWTIKIYDNDWNDITRKFTKYLYDGPSTGTGTIYLENEGENLPNGRYRIVTVDFNGLPYYDNNFIPPTPTISAENRIPIFIHFYQEEE